MSKDLNISRLCDVYGGMLTEHRRNIVRSYYDDDLSLAEIAENSGVSRQAALCSIKQAEKALNSYEKSVGYVQKLDKLNEELNEVLNALERGENTLAQQKIKAIIKDL